jgi:3-oxoacyl-[acyl-carrier-protein] synthase I
MIPIAASTLTTACGTGWRDVRARFRAGATGLRRNDFEPAADLATWIGRVDGIEAFAMPPSLARFDCRNNRLALMGLANDDFEASVARSVRRHGAQRIGVFLGTSTSGILATELAMRPGADASDLSPGFYRCRHSMFAVTELVRKVLGLRGAAITVSTACSSSAKVFALAARAIEAGVCDAAVVGGVDSLALSTLYGFNALGLLSHEPCRPLDAERDGISIGEAAGFALLDPDSEGGVALEGYGESSDGYHMSTPHPQGAGAVDAMLEALACARLAPADIGYVNLHGTASRTNDAAEDIAVHAVFGRQVLAGSTKGWTGHALGAAGIVEALVCVMALADGWVPGTLNCRRVDTQIRSRIAQDAVPMAMRHAMTNSFGFGGNNCSLVLGRRP